MKKLGIYIQYEPGLPINNQGLTRLLTQLIAGFEKHKIAYVMMIPAWMKNDFQSLLQDNQIKTEYMEIIVCPISRTFAFFLKKYLNRNRIAKPSQTTINPTESSSAAIKKTLISIKILWPLRKIFSFSRRVFSVIKENLKGTIRALYHSTVQKYFLKMIKLVNNQKEVGVWLAPSVTWPEIRLIKSKVVITVPDLVYTDFPTYFNDNIFAVLDSKIKQAVSNVAGFVTYSEYVKLQHVVNYLEKPADKVHVIRNAGIPNLQYLMPSIQDIKDAPVDEIRANAKKILGTYLQTSYPEKNLDSFLEKPYVFFATQFRPNKNIFNLIRSVKLASLSLKKPIKLILTLKLADAPELQQFILNEGMQDLIDYFYHIPNPVLASLNALATVAITPNFFEGGFSYFTFFEAYTVGTPCLLSRTAVNEELILQNGKIIPEEENIIDKTFFDPFSVSDMAEKLTYALQHPSELFNIQYPFYQRLAQRTWETVAKEYIELMQSLNS